MSGTKTEETWLDVASAVKHYGKSPRTLKRRWEAGKLKRKEENGRILYAAVVAVAPPKVKPLPQSKEPISKKKLPRISKSTTVSDYLKHAKDHASTVVVRKPVEFTGGKKILCLSDIHFPFENMDAIEEALEREGDADILVINGDLLDAYGASSYSQNKQRDILLEYAMGLEFVRKMSTRFEEVYLVEGNHERRTDTYFSKKIDPHMYALVDYDLLARMAKGIVYDEDGKEKGTYDFDNVFYAENGNSWVCKIGYAVFTHPNGYSSKEMQTVVSAMNHVDNFIGRENYDCIVMPHTHDCGQIIRCGKLLIEQGCLCSVMDYQKKGRMTRRPNSLGYAVIYLDENERVDMNRSGYTYLGSMSYM